MKDSATWPLMFVEALMVVVLLLNSPLAPLPGAVKVTVAPATGLPFCVVHRHHERGWRRRC